MDERHWLMGTAYNTGIECLQFVAPRCYLMFLTPPCFRLACRYLTKRRDGLSRQPQSLALYRMAMFVRRRLGALRFICATTVGLTARVARRSLGRTRNYLLASLNNCALGSRLLASAVSVSCYSVSGLLPVFASDLEIATPSRISEQRALCAV